MESDGSMLVRITGLIGVDLQDRAMKNFETFEVTARPIEENRFATFEISFKEGVSIKAAQTVILEEVELDIE